MYLLLRQHGKQAPSIRQPVYRSIQNKPDNASQLASGILQRGAISHLVTGKPSFLERYGIASPKTTVIPADLPRL